MRNIHFPIFLSSFLASAAFAQMRPIELGTLGGQSSVARDINEHGVIVGESKTASGDTHAFIWQQGVMQKLPSMAYRYSMANGLNNHGQVVGYVSTHFRGTSKAAKAALWQNGKLHVLPTLRGDSYSQASELNDAEEIIGVSGTRAVVWRQRKPVALGTLGGQYSIALHINAHGWIVGNSATAAGEWHACLWRDGQIIDLGTLGGRFSNANAVNDRGQIVGTSQMADGSIHTFLWEAGQMHDLGPAMGRSLTSNGWLAGEKTAASGGKQRAFLRSLAGEEVLLGELEGSLYSSAFAVNSHGMICGFTSIPVDGSEPGVFRATLWRRD